MSRYIVSGSSGGGAGGGGGGGGGTVRQERFISSGTFTVPSGVTSAEVFVVAGGGGGGRGSSWQISMPGGGGQGGQVKHEIVDLTGIASCAVVVGTGGTRASGQSSDSYNGQPGGKSSFSYGSNIIECVGGRQGISGGVGGFGAPHWFGNYNGTNSPDGDNYGNYNQSFFNTTGGHTRGAGGHGRNSSGHGHNSRMDGMNGMGGFGGGGGAGYYTSNNYSGFGGAGVDGGGISENYDWWQGNPGSDATSYAYFRWAEKNTGGGGAGGNYPNNAYGGNGADGIVIVTYSV